MDIYPPNQRTSGHDVDVYFQNANCFTDVEVELIYPEATAAPVIKDQFGNNPKGSVTMLVGSGYRIKDNTLVVVTVDGNEVLRDVDRRYYRVNGVAHVGQHDECRLEISADTGANLE